MAPTPAERNPENRAGLLIAQVYGEIDDILKGKRKMNKNDLEMMRSNLRLALAIWRGEIAPPPLGPPVYPSNVTVVKKVL